MPMKMYPRLHVCCDARGCQKKLTSTSGIEEAFAAMLRTLGWSTKMFAAVGEKSYWGWLCPDHDMRAEKI